MNNKVSYTHQYLSRTETFEKKMEDFGAVKIYAQIYLQAPAE